MEMAFPWYTSTFSLKKTPPFCFRLRMDEVILQTPCVLPARPGRVQQSESRRQQQIERAQPRERLKPGWHEPVMLCQVCGSFGFTLVVCTVTSGLSLGQWHIISDPVNTRTNAERACCCFSALPFPCIVYLL